MDTPTGLHGRADELLAKADEAKRMLDEIDETIASDNSLITDPGIIRARQMYSAEWRQCIDLARKLGSGAKPKVKPAGKLAEIRGNVARLSS